MPRGFLIVLCSTVVLGQVPRREPFDIAVESYRDARAHGNFDAAAARREEARRLLGETILDSPQWLSRVQIVAQLYQSSGRRAQARAIVQDALSRADSLGESPSIRIQLLNILADFWQQDGNLLKALSYREKAVNAQESAPPKPSPERSRPAAEFNPSPTFNRVTSRAAVSGGIRAFALGRGPNNTYLYQQLADLYRQLGRPEPAAKMMAKVRSLVQDDPRELAAFLERQGDLEQAIAVYKKQSAQAAANPQAQVWEVIGPFQSVARLYQREQRWEDAAATLKEAVSLLEASGRPEAPNQAIGMRLNLANLLQQGGQSQDAEQIYQAMLTETASDRTGIQLQVLPAYANYLSNTNRASQGEDLLKGYLANHADLQPPEQANIFFSLSQVARKAGHKELADEYQRAGTEKQRAVQPQPSGEGLLIGPELQKAQAAVSQGNLNEAVELALRVIASASYARDGEQIAWQVPSIASALASRKAPEKGEQLYHQLLILLQTWSVDNTLPLTQALQQYSRFLIAQKDRWGEVPAVIQRYRENLLAAQGAETSELEQVIHLQIDFAHARAAQAEAVQGAKELLALEESLSGTTSLPYMRAAQTAANIYQSTGNLERALALHRQIIAIADMSLPENEPQRGFVRTNAALAFANARQFEEAERLANEAVGVGERMRPPRTNLFVPTVEQIRRMKSASESGPVLTDSVVNGSALRSGGWFDVHTVQTPNGVSRTMTVGPVAPLAAQPSVDKQPAQKAGQQ